MNGRATTSIYIRVKRFDETYFLLCDEYETVESLKNRLIVVLQRMKFELPKQEEPLTIDDLRFCIKNRVLDNGSTCHDQQVFNDSVIYVCFRKPGTKDEFDELEKVASQEFFYDYPAKKKEEVKTTD